MVEQQGPGRPGRERRNTDAGVEIQCACCKEFWPEDLEFFFFSKGRAHSWCKACYRSDPKILDKTARWADKHRKGPPPEPVPQIQWGALTRALHGQQVW